MTSTAAAAFPPATPMRVVPGRERIDLAGAERAAAGFLAALGVATDDAATADTPRRMVDAYLEMLTPRSFELTTFPNDGGYDELVLARGIPLQSVCEHHMLPVPRGRPRRLPSWANESWACPSSPGWWRCSPARPQVQERLTGQVADWLQDNLRAARAWGWSSRPSTCA